MLTKANLSLEYPSINPPKDRPDVKAEDWFDLVVLPAEPFKSMFELKDKRLPVSREDARAIAGWLKTRGLVQNYLPHWSNDQRELLLSGMDKEEWDRVMGSENE